MAAATPSPSANGSPGWLPARPGRPAPAAPAAAGMVGARRTRHPRARSNTRCAGSPNTPTPSPKASRGRLDAGAWGFLDLIAGRPLLRTPALTETLRRLRAEGRDDLADRLTLVDGPLRRPEPPYGDAAAARGAARAPATGHRQAPPQPVHPASELSELVRTGHPEQIRRALTRLAERGPAPAGTRPVTDPGLGNLLAELLHHPEPRIRLHSPPDRSQAPGPCPPTCATPRSCSTTPSPTWSVRRSGLSATRRTNPRSPRSSACSPTPTPRSAGPPPTARPDRAAGDPRPPAGGRPRPPDRRHHYTAVLDQITERETAEAGPDHGDRGAVESPTRPGLL